MQLSHTVATKYMHAKEVKRYSKTKTTNNLVEHDNVKVFKYGPEMSYEIF